MATWVGYWLLGLATGARAGYGAVGYFGANAGPGAACLGWLLGWPCGAWCWLLGLATWALATWPCMGSQVANPSSQHQAPHGHPRTNQPVPAWAPKSPTQAASTTPRSNTRAPKYWRLAGAGYLGWLLGCLCGVWCWLLGLATWALATWPRMGSQVANPSSQHQTPHGHPRTNQPVPARAPKSPTQAASTRPRSNTRAPKYWRLAGAGYLGWLLGCPWPDAAGYLGWVFRCLVPWRLDEQHVLTSNHGTYMREHLQSTYMLADYAPSLSAKEVKSSLLRVRRFGGGLRELRLNGAVHYWDDVERLPTLVKSMHQKQAMQVKYGDSKGAQTHPFKAEEVKAYHLAWVSYAPEEWQVQQCHVLAAPPVLAHVLAKESTGVPAVPLLSCSTNPPMTTSRT